MYEAQWAAYTRERIQYWDQFASSLRRWQTARAYYQRRLSEIYRFLIPPGMRVLEVGCANGELLAALRPALGVGIDFSPAMIALAQRTHPELRFVLGDANEFELSTEFDYVICSDLVNDLWDVQKTLECIGRHCHAGTRVILNAYNRLWEPPRRLAEALGIAKRQLVQNWLAPEDLVNLLYLSDFEVIRTSQEILWPFRTPVLDVVANRLLVKVLPFRWFGLANFIVARPKPKPVKAEPVVSVVVPARNEEGNIPHIFERMPEMGAGTELIFVEGHSRDDTHGAIVREKLRRPDMNVQILRQQGEGKGDAVRAGFQAATGEVLMILDADLTVPPEDLPRFYEAWRSGKAEFVNGVRLVYPMRAHAMSFLNHAGNKFFSLAFSWMLGQSIKDTLCGTKVLSKRNYETIAANRAYFGEIDPFGDFDLIFGAAKYNLKMVDVPVRYRERTYGETNIQRWKHGWLLLRMLLKAVFKIKFV
ncbi:MAG: bifunctional class I SAM-dependent methyltransferase/glycosyltransferase family 2 protein [Acidobacteriota bacterium]|nr:bifunctional class I SAM-dependent methyltransferase/glycosyltransferase family 2 protein [Acidobacteriota bacterium]